MEANKTTQEKTAAIVIIGNEILSGKVVDQNIAYLTGELRSLGVAVDRVSIIPDEVDLIAEEIRASRKRSDLIFTCGGVGPTHDDVTLAGIAQGVGQPMIQHPDLLQLLGRNDSPDATKAGMKMASVPEGTRLIFSDQLSVPVYHFDEIYIFPGIPRLVVKKFEAIKDRFRQTPFHLTKIYLNQREEVIADDLTATMAKFPKLLLGSYPATKQRDYRTLLTLESKEESYLKEAFQFIMARLPATAIVRLENEQPPS